MNNKIDISVIIPLYNSEKYIKNTVQSIVKQENHGLHYEIIIVDDCSVDNSINVVRSLNCPNIRLIALEKNGGTANARNVGLEAASGEWIQFLDSDDTICNDLYQKFENVRKPDINCYIFSWIIETRDYTIKQVISEVIDGRAFGYFGSVCNKFIRRDICQKFKTAYQVEDICFIADMMNSHALNISLIEDAYYIYNCKNEQSKNANFNYHAYCKMYSYLYSQIEISNDLTRKYILEISIGLLFKKEVPLLKRIKIAFKMLIRLYRYAPSVYIKGIRNYISSSTQSTNAISINDHE